MQKIITAAKQVFIFIVSLLVITGFTVGIVSAPISAVSEENFSAFFGVNKKEFIEYISELFAWIFLFMCLFKDKFSNKIYFIVFYWFLCITFLFAPMLLV